MSTLITRNEKDSRAPVSSNMDRIQRKAERLGALLKMGGTMENHGFTLHIVGLRIDVASIADMDEAVWLKAARNIIEMLSIDERLKVAGGASAMHA